MKEDIKKEASCADGTCAHYNSKSVWMVGIAVVALATLFCFALFKTRDNQMPAQDPAPAVMVTPGAQQVAFASPNCFTCPNVTQCFPQGTTGAQQVALGCPSFNQCFPPAATNAQQVAWSLPTYLTTPVFDQSLAQGATGAQQVALGCQSFNQCFPPAATGAQQVAFANPNCMTCPSFTQCFPQGTVGTQQVAIANPNCMTCPNFTQCFPQGAPSNPQVAFGFGNSFLRCPFCNFAYTDFDAGMRGGSRCPRCFGMFPLSGFGRGGFSTVALTQPAAAPPIFRDAVMPHQYRGVCENCHQVYPDIPIPANAQMPHEYRGVCSNCHTILGAKAGA